MFYHVFQVLKWKLLGNAPLGGQPPRSNPRNIQNRTKQNTGVFDLKALFSKSFKTEATQLWRKIVDEKHEIGYERKILLHVHR